MRIKETKVIPERVETYTASRLCDLCKTEINNLFYGEREQVEIKFEYGYSTAEYGDVTTIEYDVCASCFREKIIPFFEMHGAEATKEAREW